MSSYTITIAPNDQSGNTTTLVVDAAGDQVRVTDVHLHAGQGLADGQMPVVDFGLLLRAVGAAPALPTRSAAALPATAPAVPVADRSTLTAEVAEPAPTVRRRRSTAPTKATATRAARTRTARAAKAVPAGSTAVAKAAKATKVAGAAKATKAAKAVKATKPVKAAKATRSARSVPPTKATKATKSTTGRAYRRMPDDMAAVYQQAGTAKAIADHYQVPVHTAHGWIRRVRETEAAGTTA